MKKLITALAVIVCVNFVLAQAPGCPSIDAGSNDTIDCYSDLSCRFHGIRKTMRFVIH